MPKKESPPAIRGISASDYKNRKRLIKVLVDQRLGYGRSVLFDTHKRQPRYSRDIIGTVLQKAEKKARAIGRSLEFSKDESELISQIFKAILIIGFCGVMTVINAIDNDHDGIADLIEIVLHIGSPGS